jgi:hypothetical protein
VDLTASIYAQQLVKDCYELKTGLKKIIGQIKGKLSQSEIEQVEGINEKGNERLKAYMNILNIKPEDSIKQFKDLYPEFTSDDIAKISKFKGIKMQ